MSETKKIDDDIINKMREWRHALHREPETAFAEHKSSSLVESALQAMGYTTTRIAATGIVASLKNGEGPRIGLRADLDALPLQEENKFAHRSTIDGRMHACGHDGHTAMLLGAAEQLIRTKNFKGTVNLIFQPAEEGEEGAKRMVQAGLFKQFPCDAVYGLHNWPSLAKGKFAINHGPMMASVDTFEILVQGKGTHAAQPEFGIDPIVIAAQIVSALQTISSRATSATEPLIVSVTQFHAGTAWNVLPDTALLQGTVRCLKEKTRDLAEEQITQIAKGIAIAHGGKATSKYVREYRVTTNTNAETDHAIRAAQSVVGTVHVEYDCIPAMTGEDFGDMIASVPGAYIWMGIADAEHTHPLHSPHYDFNDETLELGARYYVRLVELAK